MKKFCTKINKPQWRVTIPNLGTFKKSPKDPVDNVCKRRSGSYDVQEAQKQFEKRSISSPTYIENCSDSEDEHYKDAIDFCSLSNGKFNLTGDSLYVDIDLENDLAKSDQDEPVEYDVPRISFKFLDKSEDENYENTKESVLDNKNQANEPSNETTYETFNITPVRKKSEIKITLTAVEIDFENYNEEESKAKEQQINSKEVSPEKFISTATIHLNEYKENLTTENNHVNMRKCGSEPYLSIQRHCYEIEEGFYKVPRSLKSNRLSQSLSEFQLDEFTEQNLTASQISNGSIEHISCSQVIAQISPSEQKLNETPTNLIKSKPKTWNNFKTKFNAAMQEQAAQQRVGAFEDKEKIINFEEMYKNSKTKCRQMLKNTTKLFYKAKKQQTSQKNCVNNEDVSSVIPMENGAIRNESLKNCDVKIDISDPSNLTTSNARLNETDNNSKISDSANSITWNNNGIKSAFGKIKSSSEGQNGFDDLKRYVKQGSDFCKELATILQERADAETTYAKSLSKLSAKLSRACREGVGGLNEAWKAVAVELEARAESHRLLGVALLEEAAKPLKNVTENQQKLRKHSENTVDKASKLLSDWRTNEAKGKKNSHSCARENEKLQDAALLDNTRYGKTTLLRSTSLIQMGNNKNVNEKENSKLELKKRKAEDSVKKADIEYYTLCVRAERARLEWEAAVNKGVDTFQTLEEERLNNLKNALTSYINHSSEHVPRLAEATERIKIPIAQSEPAKDLSTFINLRHSSQQISEQLLPDFYCEHITLAMNRERRKQALIKLLHLIRQDIERERKSKTGLENLSKAIKQTPNFGAEDSQQNVIEKLYHMKSMLTYLEAARYKVQNALAELESRPKSEHPLAPHITVTRDKSGLQQSVLKVPQWLKEEFIDCDRSPMSEKSLGSNKSDPHVNDLDHENDNYWPDRGAADGNSNQPDSDFDEFSSQCSSNVGNRANEDLPVQPIAQCKALYPYTPNLNDELSLHPGDILSVYRQQDDGWWLGECNGNVGIFPATYVEIIG